uniref:Putative secreted protein n=1 Tax=Ixodes ricinus TaxID=34613 RepID=A0A6B0UZV2_IXORI
MFAHAHPNSNHHALLTLCAVVTGDAAEPSKVGVVRAQVSPDLDQVVAASGRKLLSHALKGAARLSPFRRDYCRSPAHGVAANRVGIADLLGLPDAVATHGQYGHGPVRAPACQHEAKLVGRPADGVHRGVVVGVLVELVPPAVGLRPDHHLAVVGARRQHAPKHGVRPGHLPDRALVPQQHGE